MLWDYNNNTRSQLNRWNFSYHISTHMFQVARSQCGFVSDACLLADAILDGSKQRLVVFQDVFDVTKDGLELFFCKQRPALLGVL